MLRNEMCLNIIVIVSTIFAATIIIVALTGFAKFGTAQGQADSTSLTSDQKAAMCDPSNPKLNFVNTTESHICGIPKTIKSPANASSSANTMTGAEASPTNLVPSAAP